MNCYVHRMCLYHFIICSVLFFLGYEMRCIWITFTQHRSSIGFSVHRSTNIYLFCLPFRNIQPENLCVCGTGSVCVYQYSSIAPHFGNTYELACECVYVWTKRVRVTQNPLEIPFSLHNKIKVFFPFLYTLYLGRFLMHVYFYINICHAKTFYIPRLKYIFQSKFLIFSFSSTFSFHRKDSFFVYTIRSSCTLHFVLIDQPVLFYLYTLENHFLILHEPQ